MRALFEAGAARWLSRVRNGACAVAWVVAASACGGSPVEGAIRGGDETEGGSTISCQPGSVVTCSCADGRSGIQECLVSGAELSPCRCGDASSTTTGADETEGASVTGDDADAGDDADVTSTGTSEDGGTSEDAGTSEDGGTSADDGTSSEGTTTGGDTGATESTGATDDR